MRRRYFLLGNNDHLGENKLKTNQFQVKIIVQVDLKSTYGSFYVE